MKYFSGTSNTDNAPKPLPFDTFAEFVTAHLSTPAVCHVTSAAYAKMEHREQGRAKNTRYFTAAAFKGDGRRRMGNVESVNMLVLDVDHYPEPLLAADLDTLIPWNYCLWHTLTSTPEQPRLRLVVDTTPLTVAQYKEGVAWLAARLNLKAPNPNPESLNPVQLFYHPTVFSDRETDTPIISSRVKGEPLTPQEWGSGSTAQEEDSPQTLPPTPMEGVSLEDAEEMVNFIDPDAEGMVAWLKVGMALKHQFGDEAFPLWDNWSARGVKYAGDTEARWKSFKREQDLVTFRSIVKRAKEAGWTSGPSRAKMERAIQKSTSVDELLGPILKSIRGQEFSSADLSILISKIKVRAKTAHSTTLRLPDIREALASFHSTSIPAELQGFVFVTEISMWVHSTKGLRVTPTSFDISYAKQLPGRPSIEALVALGMRQVDREGFDPTRPSELIYSDAAGISYLNTYRQSYPGADPQSSEEAGQIINTHLELLFPAERSRDLLLSWMSWCLSNLGSKCHWHVFIQGVQGCGKTLVAEALAACFGPTNSRKVGNHMLTERFNSWSDKVLFLYFEEVLLGERQKDTMEVIKDLVTGQSTNIRAMRTDAVERPNHVVGGMFISNHLHGLRLEHSDRRFFCLCCAPQSESQVQAIPDHDEHFTRLARLKGDLAGGLRHYLLNRPIAAEFRPYGHAPHTPDRDLVMRAGSTEVDSAIMMAIDSGNYDLITPAALAIAALTAAVRSELRYVSTKAVSRALSEAGWKPHGQRVLASGDQHTVWFNPERLNGATPVEVLNASIAAKDVL